MNKTLIFILIVGTILISACTSSFEDCYRVCKYQNSNQTECYVHILYGSEDINQSQRKYIMFR